MIVLRLTASDGGTPYCTALVDAPEEEKYRLEVATILAIQQCAEESDEWNAQDILHRLLRGGWPIAPVETVEVCLD